MLFVFVDLDEQDNFKVLEFFGIPLKDCPTYRFVNLGSDEPLKYKPEVTAIDKASMETFVGNVLEGKIKVSKLLFNIWNFCYVVKIVVR